MAVFRDRDKLHFPLKNIQAVVNLFKDQLEGNAEPNLALLSIVLGIVEHNLTVNRNVSAHLAEDRLAESSFPVVDLAPVEALYHRFVCLIRGSIDLTHHDSPYATRELVKRASDVVWAGLSRGSYKDKAHLQSLYVYLTGKFPPAFSCLPR
jgi:menin